MAGRYQNKRGTYAAMDLNALYQGELYYCTDTKQLFIAHGDGTGKELASGADAAAILASLGLTATAAELNYTDGVTSAIQTQLDAKAAVAQQAWQAPTLINSWANYGGAFTAAGYYKDTLGIVHLRGVIKTGSVPSVAFVLPTGYRPSAEENFSVDSNSAHGTVKVDASGNVSVVVGSSTYASLSGVTFRIA